MLLVRRMLTRVQLSKALIRGASSNLGAVLQSVDIIGACEQEIAKKEGLSLKQVIAVGDGANDIPMLKLAGLGVAFHAKPKVKEQAKVGISTLGLDGILYLLGVRDRESFKDAHDDTLNEVLLPQAQSRL